MKRKKDQKVVDLIKSLSQSEKRYISINIDKYGGNTKIYKLLFNEILKAKKYDEEAIKRKILTEKEFSQFHVVKNYLFNTILKLLHSYHQNKTQEGIINSLMFESDYLFKKEVVSESIKRLQKAKRIAYKYEFFHLIVEILRREVKFDVSDYKTNDSLKSTNEIFIEENKILTILKNISLLNQQSVALYNKINDSTISKQELRAYVKNIIEHPILKTNYFAFCNQIVKHHILSEAHVIIGNHEKSYYYNQAQIDLFEKNPHQKTFLKSFYYPVLFNFIYKNIYLNKHELADNLLDDLLLIIDTNDNLHINLKYRYLHLKAFLFIKKGVFNQDLFNEIETFYLNKKSSLNNNSFMMLLFSNLALAMVSLKSNLTKLSRIIMQIDYASVKDDGYKRVLTILTYVLQDKLENINLRNNYATKFRTNNQSNYEHLNSLEKAFYNFFKTNKLTTQDKVEISTLINNYNLKNNNLDPDNIYNYFNFEKWLLKKLKTN